MKAFILSLLLITFSPVYSQGFSSYIGFNTNPILAQVVPFNNINPQVTMASLMFRSYNMNNNGIRAGYGLSLGDQNDFNNMYLSVDNDRRRELGGRWVFFQGIGIAVKIMTNNSRRVTTTPVREEYTMSFGWHWGAEYVFNEVFSLSTEATFKLGVRLNQPGAFLKIDPPINIMAHFNLYN